MADNDFIWRFTPSRTEPHVLEQIFVQRGALLVDLVERVRESALTDNKHQILLIGPRGIGKTHLIALIHHRVTKDPTLSNVVRIAWLLEDETITSFVQLLKRVYELLADEYPTEFSREWLEDLLDRPPAAILKALEAALVDQFRDKTLLVFVENLDLVFEGLGDAGQKQWRAFLQNHPFTSVVATSQRLFKGVKSRDQPFFGFFTSIHLKPLPAPDAVDLLGRIARQRELADLLSFLATPEGRSRVRALHHLAGGNHRIYIVLSGFITRESLDELTGPFEKMADELTPYYQERMRWLSPQQRQIVEYLCAREDTCTPKEIARQLLTSENSVSSQLKKLSDLGYVLSNPRGRESLYELAEPLMRLAGEVKEKRRRPLRLLVNFLRIWYRPDVLPQLLEKAASPSLRAHLKAAIDQSRSKPDPRLKVLEAEIEKAREENRRDDLLQILEELVHTRGSANDWLELALNQCELGKFEFAVECFDKTLEIDPLDASAWTFKGYALHALGRHESAVECYDKALGIEPRYAFAWYSKGYTLDDLGRYESAVECHDKALGIDPLDALAWRSKGYALGNLNRYEAAIECFDKALGIDPLDAVAWDLKGNLLTELHRYAEAAECLDKALEIDPRDQGFWNNKGHLLYELGRYQAARECYEQAFGLDSFDPLYLFARCESSLALGHWEAAFVALREAFERNPRHTGHDVKSFIDSILRLSEGREELRQLLATLIAIYQGVGKLTYLGDGLVRSLRKIDARRRNRELLEDWWSAWMEQGGGHAELEVPLRIFRVGIEYLIRGDAKVLLDLVSLERTILQQALGLGAEDGVEERSQARKGESLPRQG